MASGPGVNQGKTAFLEEFLPGKRGVDEDAVNEAWNAAGNEGSISASLINKMRSKLGLTGKRGRAPSPGKLPVKTGAKRGRPRKHPLPAEKPSFFANGRSAFASAPASSGRHDAVLDEMEEGIDDLIRKIADLGGRPGVVQALRHARRLLVRSHEG